jgi:hypothetical protein
MVPGDDSDGVACSANASDRKSSSSVNAWSSALSSTEFSREDRKARLKLPGDPTEVALE